MTQPAPEPQAQPEPTSVVQPVPQAQPVATPSVDAVKLHNYLKVIDLDQNGVGLDKTRPIYPKIGWNVILSHCAELESANMLSKRMVAGPNGRGGYDLYTWQ